jgi:hypothetical protein
MSSWHGAQLIKVRDNFTIYQDTTGMKLLLLRLYSPFVGPWLLFECLDPIHGRTPWMGDQPITSPLPKHRKNAHTDIHTSSGIRTHNPSVRANEDSSCLRLRGHCDWC